MNSKLVRKTTALVLAILLVISSVNLDGIYTFAASGQADGLKLVHDVDKTSLFSGEEFSYTLKYSLSGADVYNDLQLVEEVSPLLEIIAYDDSSIFKNISRNGNTITYEFKDGVTGGTSGVLNVTVKFKAGETPKNAVADSTTATLSSAATNKSVAVTAPVVSAKIKDTTAIVVDKIAPSITPALDNDVYYTLEIKGEPVIGGRNLKDVVIVDTLPAEAIDVIPITAGGTWDAGTRTITWEADELNVGQTKTFKLKCKYSGLDLNDSVTNQLDVTAEHFDDNTAVTGSDSVSHQFATATFGTVSVDKQNRTGNALDQYATGQTAKFSISGINNPANVSVDTIEVVDILPKDDTATQNAGLDITTGPAIKAILLDSVYVGEYNNDVPISLYYNTVEGGAYQLYEENISNGATISITDNGGASGSIERNKLHSIKLVLGGTTNAIPVGFAMSNSIRVNGEVIAANDQGQADYINKAEFTLIGSETKTSSDSVTFKVNNAIPRYALSLSTNKNAYIDSEDIKYTLTVGNHNLARGDINPNAGDSFVVVAEFDKDDFDTGAKYDYISGSAGVTELSSLPFDGSGDKIYRRWRVDKRLEPAESVTIKFSDSIKDKNPTGNYTVKAYVVVDSNEDLWESAGGTVVTEPIDLNDNGATDKLIEVDHRVYNKYQGQVTGKKYIKGELGTDNYLDVTATGAQTVPGGYVDYKIRVSNADGGNDKVSNIVVIDKFSRKGDTSITDNTARGSQWSPYLIGEAKVVNNGDIQQASGHNGLLHGIKGTLKIYYTTAENPDISILEDTTKAVSADWTLTAPENIIDVTHILLKLEGYELQPNEYVEVEFRMVAPAGAPVNSNAYNSFAYGATYPTANGKGSFLPAEPNKVFHTIPHVGTNFGIGTRVFYDTNNDGIDNESQGINGVKLILYKDNNGTLERIRHTYSNKNQADKDGYYLFPRTLKNDDNGNNSNYDIVALVPKSEHLHISPHNVTTATEETDNDFAEVPAGDLSNYQFLADEDTSNFDVYSYSAANGSYLGVTGADTEAFVDKISVGLYRLSPITGKVFNDYNHDGIKQNNEPFMSGVTVKLIDTADNSVKATDTTTANGEYNFDNLEPAIYKVKVELKDNNYGYSPTASSGTVHNQLDSNGEKTGLSLKSGETIEVNAAMHKSMIKGQIFFDANYDGTKNNGDKGIKDFTIKLFMQNGTTKLRETTSDNSGNYYFDDLDAGNYKIEIVPQNDYYVTKQETGSFVSNKSYVSDDGNHIIENVAVPVASVVENVNAGYYKKIKLQGFIFNDSNIDGKYDQAKEKTNLKTNTDDIVLTITGGELTNEKTVNAVFKASTGKYEYKNVELDPSANAYKITFDNPDLANLKATTEADSGVINDSNQESVFVEDGNNFEFSLTDPVASKDGKIYYINAGLHKAKLKLNLFEDADYSGTINGNEDYFVTANNSGDVIISLQKNGGAEIIQKPTSKESIFENLDAGDYTLKVKIKTDKNYKPSKDNDAEVTAESGFDVHTYNFTIAKAEEKTLSEGFYRPASVETKIFFDKNYNGIFDNNEEKTDLLTKVELMQNNNLVKTLTTSDNGLIYTAEELKPGNYQLVYTPVDATYLVTKKNVNGNNTAVDNDVNANNTIDIALKSGEKLTQTDLGLYQQVKISGKMFIEHSTANSGTLAGGIFDTGDEGYNGDITVEVYDSANHKIETKTVTVVNGDYEFKINPNVNDVSLKYQIPSGYLVSPIVAPTAANPIANQLDEMGKITLPAISGNNKVVNYGIYVSGIIKGSVYNDKNADGQRVGDDPVAGVVIELLDGNGNPITDANNIAITTTTDADGAYQFTGLKQGSYKVRVKKPDYVNTTTISDAVNVTSNDTFVKDFNIYKNVKISGNIFEELYADENILQLPNGIKDNSDALYQGDVTVSLLDGTGAVIAGTTQTVNNGEYEFTDLKPNTYKVQFTLPNDYLHSPVAMDNTKPSNKIDSTLVKEVVMLSPTNQVVDYGIYKNALIKGSVFNDKNGNMTRDSGENDLNATITLLDQAGNPVAGVAPITYTGGEYQFTNVPPAVYKVKVEVDGFDDRISGEIVANPKTEKEKIFAISKTVKLSGTIFEEISPSDNVTLANGLKDGIDKLYDGEITVSLLNNIGQVLETQTVNNGVYEFAQVTAGEHTLKFSKPAHYVVSPTATGGNQLAEVNAKVELDFTAVSPHNMVVDYGIYKGITLNGTIYNDSNANQSKNTGEQGIAKTIELLKNGNVVASVNSINGSYVFSDLEQGDYQLRLVDVDAYQGQKTRDITLVPKADATTENFGIYKNVKISGSIFEELYADENILQLPDGIKDASDALYQSAVTVSLLDETGNAIVGKTKIVTNGEYEFIDLKPATYKVQFTLPNGYLNSPVATDNTKPSNKIDSTLVEEVVMLSPVDKVIDYGIYKNAVIKGNIFNDENDDEIQNTGENDLNATITLLDKDGTPVAGVAPINYTGGEYKFENLKPAIYKLKVEVNGFGDRISDKIVVNPKSEKEKIFAISKKVKIKGNIFEEISPDDNATLANGLQDGIDKLYNGEITVKLLDGNGQALAAHPDQVVTDGTYEFKHVNAGDYTIKFTKPNNYFVSPTAVDGNQFVDDNGKIELKVTAISPQNIRADYGLYKGITLNGTIYTDSNADQTKDAGEQAIAKKIELLQNGAVIDSVDSVDGSYVFSGLAQGDYQLRLVDVDDYQGQKTRDITLVSKADAMTENFGIYKDSAIKGKVFLDKNRNGINENEMAFSNLVVELIDSANTVISEPVKVDGSFAFYDLKPAEYKLKVKLAEDYHKLSPKAKGSDNSKDSDIDPVTMMSDKLMLTSGSHGEINLGIGVYKIVNLAGKVTDLETGQPLANATIRVLDENGAPVLDENGIPFIYKTGADGTYQFANLYPDVKYQIKVESVYTDNGQTIKYPDIIKDVPASGGGDIVMDFVSSKYDIHFVADPEVIVGDGKSTSELTFTIKNQDGTAVKNQVVVFDANFGLDGNELNESKKGTFQDDNHQISLVTDDEGKIVTDFTAADLAGYLEVQKVKVKFAASLANGKQLADDILMIFEPISVSGTVRGQDREGNSKIYANTPITIKKVFKDKALAPNDPRLIDKEGYKLSNLGNDLIFEYQGITDDEGKYKIFVPFSGQDYDLKVAIAKEQSPTGKELEFIQQAKVASNSGAESLEVVSDKTIVGTVMVKTSDKEKAQTNQLDVANLSIEYEQAGHTLEYAVDSDGVIQNKDPNGAKLRVGGYQRTIYYTFPDGQKIIVAQKTIDDVENGDLVIEDILIDPRGYITDAADGKPVVNAKVTLYYEDGKQVELPKSGFALSNNDNPQFSTIDGEYAWMVYPQSVYYILATADGYYSYDSRRDGGELRYEGETNSNFLLNGLIEVKDKIAYWDFKMRKITHIIAPPPSSSEDESTETTETTTESTNTEETTSTTEESTTTSSEETATSEQESQTEDLDDDDDDDSDDDDEDDGDERPTVKKTAKPSPSVATTTTTTTKDTEVRTETPTTDDENANYLQEIVADKDKVMAGETVNIKINYINKTAKTLEKAYLKIKIPQGLKVKESDKYKIEDNYIYYPVENLKADQLEYVDFDLETEDVDGTAIYQFESVLIDENMIPLSALSRSWLKVYDLNGEKVFDGYIYGRPDGGFHPDDNMTRAEVAAILVRNTINRTPDTKKEFKDVAKDAWYYDEVMAAAGYNYFDGYQDGTFKPDEYVTRGELARILLNFFHINAEQESILSKHFSDIEHHYFEKDIEIIAKNKLVNGYPDNTYRPDELLNRSEAVKMFNRILFRYPTPNVKRSFNDITEDFWAFGDIESSFRGFKIVEENGAPVILPRKKKNIYFEEK